MKPLALKLLKILTCIWSSSLVDSCQLIVGSFNYEILISEGVIEIILKSV